MFRSKEERAKIEEKNQKKIKELQEEESEDKEESETEEPPKLENKDEPERESKKEKRPSWVQFEAPNKEGHKIEFFQGKAAIMREKLLRQRMRPLYIPRDQGEDIGIKLAVNLNGYKLLLPKNAYIEVPEQVFDIVRKSKNQVDFAYQQMAEEFGIDRPTSRTRPIPFTDALN